jgi:hypothetical protein
MYAITLLSGLEIKPLGAETVVGKKFYEKMIIAMKRFEKKYHDSEYVVLVFLKLSRTHSLSLSH